MKCMIIAICALVLAVNAKPFDGLSIGGGLGATLGHHGHHGLGALATQYQQGGLHANNAYNQGAHGYGAQGYQTGGAVNQYDRGAQESSFSSITQGHQKSSHDRGSSAQFGSSGGSMGGFDQFANGMSNLATGFQGGSTLLTGI